MRFLLILGLMAAGCSADTFSTNDAATPDASNGEGGGGNVEAGNGEGGSGDGSLCSSPPVCSGMQVCASFDTGMVAPFSNAAKGSGTVTTSMLERVSCPDSMLATLPAQTSVSLSRATISDGAPVVGSHVVLELDVILPAMTSPATFFSVYPDTGGSVGLAVDGTGTWVLTVQGGTQLALAPQPPTQTWTHMKLEVTFSNNALIGGASITCDGKKTPYSGVTTPSDGGAPSVGVSIGIDPGGNTTTQAMSAYYDNVVYTPL